MFFIIARGLGMVILFLGCAYAYIAWCKKAEMRSQIAEAIDDIDFTLNQAEGVHYNKAKLEVARNKLNKLLKEKKK